MGWGSPSPRRALIEIKMTDRERLYILSRPPHRELISSNLFQSTPSVGRATAPSPYTLNPHSISIHALRGEGDTLPLRVAPMTLHFNPRPPWGGRHKRKSLPLIRPYFNPRPPWGGRQNQRYNALCPINISIHALRGEGDPNGFKGGETNVYFNPRPPWGGRLLIIQYGLARDTISIHALRGEGDNSILRS